MFSFAKSLPEQQGQATEEEATRYQHALSWFTGWAAFVFATLLGFARLSYGLLLPALKADLHVTYSTLSGVATLNFVGYLLGTLGMPWLLARIRNQQRLNLLALLGTQVTMVGAALSMNSWQLGAWRLCNGLFAAIATVLTMTLSLECIYPRERGQASGMIWMGGALGLMLSGLIAPPIIAAGTTLGWRLVWLVMGSAGIIAALGFYMARSRQTMRRPVIKGMDSSVVSAEKTSIWLTLRPLFLPRRLLWLSLTFLGFGGGYITYFTFFISLLTQQGVPTLYAGFVWAAIGLAASVSSWIWGRLLDRRPSGFTLALPLALGVLGSLVVLTNMPLIEYIGAALVGLSALLGPPLMITVLLKRAVPDSAYAISYSTLTALFATGQILGPLLGGLVIGWLGLQAGIASSALLLGLAALCACGYGWVQREK
ncbi:YbfB/YjiJ family MFS transporter [Dictyobacter formicarum]|uniref:MFS transporter n=1 Tax=Dictyobacter formicarum TaxID=2778368 RepID=A0ABQ3VI57_9CHLR|nr:YbfB/YjiJ family MFS transporter [Dictyobacter formicarum]GHO85735.1 MFS transporter [Dictyobacter formicarum]